MVVAKYEMSHCIDIKVIELKEEFCLTRGGREQEQRLEAFHLGFYDTFSKRDTL